MTLTQAFAFTVHKLRTDRKLSQGALAEACKLDRTFISMLERGRRQPTISTLFKLGKALKLPAHEILRRTERVLAKKQAKAPYLAGPRRL